MKYSKVALAAAAATLASAQEGRPEDVSICDYYTTALLENNTAENQATLLTLVVNTVVIGNYTMPNVGISVPGILAPGEVDGEKVELLGYFDGSMATTNRGGDEGEKVNFLDGGGAEPLMDNKPADDDKSRQYFLLTHLYQFFGALLGCTEQGVSAFPSYTGDASQYGVHKFMNLNNAEVTYFIQNVGMAAASFGVAEADVQIVGKALMDTFGYRCSPAAEVIPGQGKQLQSICVDSDCPADPKADCEAYGDKNDMPGSNSTMTGTDGMPTPTGDSPSTVPTGTGVPAGAASIGFSFAAIAAGLAAFAL